MIKPARRTKNTLGRRVFKTVLDIEFLVIGIYLKFGACHLLFLIFIQTIGLYGLTLINLYESAFYNLLTDFGIYKFKMI